MQIARRDLAKTHSYQYLYRVSTSQGKKISTIVVMACTNDEHVGAVVVSDVHSVVFLCEDNRYEYPQRCLLLTRATDAPETPI